MTTPKRSALGRGLDSLISMDDIPASGTSAINEIPLSQISANPDQPRTNFDQTALQELATSIREVGIIQPISLRKTGPDSYQILAGERRFRAAAMAGLHSVPAYIRSATEAEVSEIALIENIQREDLDPIEIALSFRKLIDQHNLTQERLSERVGKKRATIANFMRLLKLPAEIQLGLRDGNLNMGHARALITLEDPQKQLSIYKLIVKQGLSVRKVEELVKKMREGAEKDKDEEATPEGRFTAKDFDLLRDHLSKRFRAPVNFACDRSGKGKITFSFRSEDELERLITIFDEIKGEE